jgi:hypothetical protein
MRRMHACAGGLAAERARTPASESAAAAPAQLAGEVGTSMAPCHWNTSPPRAQGGGETAGGASASGEGCRVRAAAHACPPSLPTVCTKSSLRGALRARAGVP